MAVKKAPVAKKAEAKKVLAAKKRPAAKSAKVKAGNKPSVDEAIHYYLGPDGKVVREVFDWPEPKRLSRYGEWAKAHPKGIIKILDMKAVMR